MLGYNACEKDIIGTGIIPSQYWLGTWVRKREINNEK